MVAGVAPDGDRADITKPVEMAEMALLLNVKPRTLRRWIAEQRIPRPDNRFSRKRQTYSAALANRILGGQVKGGK